VLLIPTPGGAFVFIALIGTLPQASIYNSPLLPTLRSSPLKHGSAGTVVGVCSHQHANVIRDPRSWETAPCSKTLVVIPVGGRMCVDSCNHVHLSQDFRTAAGGKPATLPDRCRFGGRVQCGRANYPCGGGRRCGAGGHRPAPTSGSAPVEPV